MSALILNLDTLPKTTLLLFNLSNSKIFSFSRKQIEKFPESVLYLACFQVNKKELIFDNNNFIFLDTRADIFEHISDFIKGYEISYTQINIADKRKLYRDALMYNLPQLAEKVSEYLPDFSSQNRK